LLPEPTTLHVAMEDREGGAPESQGRGGRMEERGGWQERHDRDEDERRAARGAQGEQARGYEEREGGEARVPRGGREEERRGGEQHRGWHGDPKRHAEASRRGWEHRR
jgi:hypothetical protein